MANTEPLLSHFYVTLDGANAPDDFMGSVLRIAVENSLHLPDIATVTLFDPRLHWIDDARLEPGKTLTISAAGGAAGAAGWRERRAAARWRRTSRRSSA